MKPSGLLASVDLAADIQSPAYEVLLPGWMTLMAAAGVDAQMLERARAAYARDVAVLPAQQVAGIIQAAGFETHLAAKAAAGEVGHGDILLFRVQGLRT